jgi:hypothetical protein
MILLAVALGALAGCRTDVSPQKESSVQDSTRMTTPSITDVLARHTPHLMSIAGVVGTAEGRQDGRPCIIVFVKEKTTEIERAIPKQLEGYPVRIDAVGEVGPLR